MDKIFVPDFNYKGEQLGEAGKQYAFSLFELNRLDYLLAARRTLLAILFEHGTATINDVRRVLPVPQNVNPKCLGAVPCMLAKAGIIRGIGFEKSDRAIAHARPVTRWELADVSKATAWVAANPLPERGSNK